MSVYKLENENKTFELDAAKCGGFFNDDEQAIDGFDETMVIDLLNGSDQVFFSREYYDQACENCHENGSEDSKNFAYLEFHFFAFSKEGKYVMSSLSEAYKGKRVKRLFNEGIADGSYIVSVNVCEVCGDFTIELEYGLF